MSYSDSIVQAIMDNDGSNDLSNASQTLNNIDTSIVNAINGQNNVYKASKDGINDINTAFGSFTEFNKALQDVDVSERTDEENAKARNRFQQDLSKKEQYAITTLNKGKQAQIQAESNNDSNQVNSNNISTPTNELSHSFDQSQVNTQQLIADANNKTQEQMIYTISQGVSPQTLSQNIDSYIDSKFKQPQFKALDKSKIRKYLMYPDLLNSDKQFLNSTHPGLHEVLSKLSLDGVLSNALNTEREVNILREQFKEGILPFEYHQQVAQVLKAENPYYFRNKDVNQLAIELATPEIALSGRVNEKGQLNTQQEMLQNAKTLDFRNASIGNTATPIPQDTIKQAVAEALKEHGIIPSSEPGKTPKKAIPQQSQSTTQSTSLQKNNEITSESSETPTQVSATNPFTLDNAKDYVAPLDENDKIIDEKQHNIDIANFENSKTKVNSSIRGLSNLNFEAAKRKEYEEVERLMSTPGYTGHFTYPSEEQINKKSVLGQTILNTPSYGKLIALNKKSSYEYGTFINSDGSLSSNGIDLLNEVSLSELQEAQNKFGRIVNSGKDSDGNDVISQEQKDDAKYLYQLYGDLIKLKENFEIDVNKDPSIVNMHKAVSEYQKNKNKLIQLADKIKVLEDEFDNKKLNGTQEEINSIKSRLDKLKTEYTVASDGLKLINKSIFGSEDLNDAMILHFWGHSTGNKQVRIHNTEYEVGTKGKNAGVAFFKAFMQVNLVQDDSYKSLESIIDRNHKLQGLLLKLGNALHQGTSNKEALSIQTELAEELTTIFEKDENQGLTFQLKTAPGDDSNTSLPMSKFSDYFNKFIGNYKQAFGSDGTTWSGHNKFKGKKELKGSPDEKALQVALIFRRASVITHKKLQAQEQERKDKKEQRNRG